MFPTLLGFRKTAVGKTYPVFIKVIIEDPEVSSENFIGIKENFSK